MANKIINEKYEMPVSSHQHFFIKFILAVLVDLVVLGLFNEYWDYVKIDSFSIALIASLLLQVLLKLTLLLEHRVAAYFNNKTGVFPKIMRFLSAWLILFISKLIILEAINYAFGDHVLFLGPYHGIIAFIVVVVAILIAEAIVSTIYKSLA